MSRRSRYWVFSMLGPVPGAVRSRPPTEREFQSNKSHSRPHPPTQAHSRGIKETMLVAWFPLAVLAASAPVHESAVQRHHRKGVHCMDVIERSKCAIEQFEAVLDEDTRERELVTDAIGSAAPALPQGRR